MKRKASVSAAGGNSQPSVRIERSTPAVRARVSVTGSGTASGNFSGFVYYHSSGTKRLAEVAAEICKVNT